MCFCFHVFTLESEMVAENTADIGLSCLIAIRKLLVLGGKAHALKIHTQNKQ